MTYSMDVREGSLEEIMGIWARDEGLAWLVAE